jgi:hypothetical protein
MWTTTKAPGTYTSPAPVATHGQLGASVDELAALVDTHTHTPMLGAGNVEAS